MSFDQANNEEAKMTGTPAEVDDLKMVWSKGPGEQRKWERSMNHWRESKEPYFIRKFFKELKEVLGTEISENYYEFYT